MPILSRRSFVSLAAIASASPFLPALAGSSKDAAPTPAAAGETIRLNFNESPFGPSESALAAMRLGAEKTGRYHYGEQLRLIELFAEQNRIPQDHVHAFSGSREALQHALSAFTGERSLVMATPSYDAVAEAAQIKGIKVHEVPLTGDDAHDLPAMLSTDPRAGLIYICNPNNPTGTLTPREAIEQAAADKPAGSILLIDEAYIHFADAPDCLALATKREDVLVLRTFSKVYGMAGARLGLAVGHPRLLQRMELFGGGNFVPLPAALGGIASLEDAALVAQRKRINDRIREETLSALRGHGLACTRSQTSCFMVDTGHPAEQVIEALSQQNVLVGRPWSVRPTWVRVSVGTAEEMQAFQRAFARVMAQLGPRRTA